MKNENVIDFLLPFFILEEHVLFSARGKHKLRVCVCVAPQARVGHGQ